MKSTIKVCIAIALATVLAIVICASVGCTSQKYWKSNGSGCPASKIK